MYEIYERAEDCWEVHTKLHGAYAGDFIGIMRHCIEVLDMTAEELEIGISEMCKNKHNCAHFGMRKRFIYTYNRVEKNVA